MTASPDGLPPELEDAAWQVLLAGPAEQREAEFTRLLAAHPLHAPALQALRVGAVGAEAALRRSGLALPPQPERIGAYRLLRRLGEGGFGVVWLAEQDEPIQRQVALKLIRPGMDTAAVLQRFAVERDLLARLEHPHVARVLDAGLADGSPFLVTEYVAGEPLMVFATRRGLSRQARLQLFLRICDGVQHAHQRGVIHRDLKPSNVLVAEVDGRPWPKVIDFGLARAFAGPVGDAVTRAGALLGTPEYMAPEQARGGVVDIRSDVHALGVMLFELLVDDLPHGREAWRRAELPQLLALIDAEVPRPGVMSVAAGRWPADLDWIVLQAVHKDPERRYGTVAALAADIAAFLDDRPVAAGRPGVGYHLRKFVRRHRGQVLAALAVAASLVVGLIAAVAAWQRSQRAERTATLAGERAQTRLREFLQLAAVVRLQRLREEASVWRPPAERVAAWTTWVQEARALLAQRDEIAAALRAAEQPANDQRERDAAAFARAQMRRHLADLDALAADGGLLARVEGRLAWAGSVHAMTLEQPAAAWAAAIAAIAASPRYGGLRLRPQLGLVPLGADPRSGLWEFVHLQSGPPPGRNGHGVVVGDPASGIVFVLLPGGIAHVGAQRDDPAAPFHDPAADVLARRHDVALEPFFLAKYELMRGQWERAIGARHWALADGTATGADPIGPAFPADSLDWQGTIAALRDLDLTLPTDAQWEYACRAGSATPWPTGSSPNSLARVANLAGRETAGMAGGAERHSPEHFDRFVLPAPVGSLAPNAFGLYDTLGNIAELCSDSVLDARSPPRPGDGLRVDGARDRAVSVRGGAFSLGVDAARSAAFGLVPPDSRNPDVGARPARGVDR